MTRFHEINATSMPDDTARVLPLIGNDEIKLNVDSRGVMHEFTPKADLWYGTMPPQRIVWAGRRHNRTPDRYNSNLFEWGLLDMHLDGEAALPDVTAYRQRLIPREGIVETVITRGTVEERTVSFVHLEHNLIVFHRAYKGLAPDPCRKLRALYALCQVDVDTLPHLVQWQPHEPWDRGIAASSIAHGMSTYNGRIALFSDLKGDASSHSNRLTLAVPMPEDGAVTVYLSFADDLGASRQMLKIPSGDWISWAAREVNDEINAMPEHKADYAAATDAIIGWTREAGYAGVLASQKAHWKAYYDQVDITLPKAEALLSATLDSQLYCLRCTWTRYDMPPGCFNTSWGAGYFWDGRFGIEGVLAAGVDELARRSVEWRRLCLPYSCMAVGGRGARYPWTAVENGTPIADRNAMHFFSYAHLGVIVNYIYEYCRYHPDTATVRRYYPVIREIAEFYQKWLIVELPGNGLMIVPTVDIDEGRYPVQDGPFTLCGAARVMQVAVLLAEQLNVDTDKLADWKRLHRHALAMLHTLPDGEHTGSTVSAIGGYVDYSLHDLPKPDVRIDPVIAQWRREERTGRRPKAARNDMHGQQTVPRFWSWGYVSSAYRYASLEQPEKALETLKTSLKTLMDFATFNESSFEDLSRVHHPWFATTAGGYVRALTRMLVRPCDDAIYIAPGIPAEWRDFAFSLPVHGEGKVAVRIVDGTITQLTITEMRAGRHTRTVHLPTRFLDRDRLCKQAEIIDATDAKMVVRVAIEDALTLIG